MRQPPRLLGALQGHVRVSAPFVFQLPRNFFSTGHGLLFALFRPQLHFIRLVDLLVRVLL
jgi:hypothetical protein